MQFGVGCTIFLEDARGRAGAPAYPARAKEGGGCVNKNGGSPPNEQPESQGLVNVLKLILLVAILVGAWFLLDRMIGNK